MLLFMGLTVYEINNYIINKFIFFYTYFVLFIFYFINIFYLYEFVMND